MRDDLAEMNQEAAAAALMAGSKDLSKVLQQVKLVFPGLKKGSPLAPTSLEVLSFLEACVT